MMIKLTIVSIAAALALLTGPLAAAAECTGMKPGVNSLKVMSGGREQRIDLVLPASFDSSKRLPLVIGLHPSGATGITFDEDTGLKAAATAKGFAVMFPDGALPTDDGSGRFWNIP